MAVPMRRGGAIVIWLCGVFLFLTMNFMSAPGWAQSEPTAPAVLSGDLSEKEFRDVLGRLSDEQVREIVIQEFAARRNEKTQSDAGLMATARDVGERLSVNARALVSKWPLVDDAFAAIASRLNAAGGVWLAILALIISFAAGFAARFFWRRRAAERQYKLAERNAGKGAYATPAIIGDAILYLLIDLSSVLIFAVAAVATVYLIFHNPDLRFFVSSYVAAVSVVLFVRSLVEMMFPRHWPVYRMVAISDSATRLLHWLIFILTVLWAFGEQTANIMIRFGSPEGTPEFLNLVVSVIWLILAFGGLRLLYRETAELLPAREDVGLANAVTRNWALLLGGIVVVIWGLFVGGGLLSGAAQAASAANTQILAVMFGFWSVYRILVLYLRAQDVGDEFKAAFQRVARALLVAFGIVISLAVWGMDPVTLKESGLAGLWIQAAVNVGLTALIGWAIWDFIRTLIDARLAKEQPEDEEEDAGDGEGGLGASRTATLLPLLRSFALAAIGMTCLFSAASSLGINVAPLIAGAGVVGLAIGFGAQTLVKDVVSGVFFLIDDAFRRGEYIDLGTVKGTVERISVRSLQLRHQLGAVHTIPFGEIAALTNYSRDWVIMKLPLRLTFDTDPQQVKKIVKRIGAEMKEDPEMGAGLMEPPKSQGVIQMDDSAMILRVKFKAIPGEQFVIRRELLHRIRAAFEEAGIRFASREVTVRVNDDAQASREEAIGGAARLAIEAQTGADA